MNKELRESLKPMNELTPVASGLGALLHGGTGLPDTFSRDIYLTKQQVVGTRFVGGAEDLAADLKPGSRVTLLHEADNRFDEKAVMVIDEKGRKLGYLPRYQNAVVCALLDAGKVFYGIIREQPGRMDPEDEASPYKLWIDLFMREFPGPGDMSGIPRNGDRGSWCIAAVRLADGTGGISGLFAVKIINGEERGHFYRECGPGADREAMRAVMAAFDEFAGFLPIIGHGISGAKREALEEVYGVFLGKPFSNQVVDTEKMARIHLPDITDSSLESYAGELGIECGAEEGPERECRLAWGLYCRLFRSELERKRTQKARMRTNGDLRAHGGRDPDGAAHEGF